MFTQWFDRYAKGMEVDMNVVDNADWRSNLTPEEDDKVDDILDFVESFGLPSLGAGSLVAIIAKLIDELESPVKTEDAPTVSDPYVSDWAAPNAGWTINSLSDRLTHEPYSAEQLERIRSLAATAKIRKVDMAIVYGPAAHYAADNAEAVELMRDYDFRLTKLVYMIQALQKDLETAKQTTKNAVIRLAAHGSTLSMPFDTQERAKLLYTEFSKNIVGPSWIGLSLSQREGWMNVARLIK